MYELKKSRIGIAAALLFIASTASGATRTVPFVGMVALEMQTVRLHNLNNVAFCYVTVVNSGGSVQNPVTIQGFGLGGVNGCFLNGVSDQSIGPGEFCYNTFQMATFLDSVRMGVCSGLITVTDANATTPGAVAAVGAITVFQEAMVVGGVLSGAHYVSGNVIAPNATAGNRSGNMNLNCAAACQANNLSTNRNQVCETLCGVSSTNAPYYPPNPTTIGATLDSNASADSATTPLASVPEQVMHYAPSYYAGGSVYEVEMGALDAICNGNPTFVSDGYSANPHSHMGGSAQNGNEVLFCGHRHNLPDLYLKVGQTVPIVINGGSSF